MLLSSPCVLAGCGLPRASHLGALASLFASLGALGCVPGAQWHLSPRLPKLRFPDLRGRRIKRKEEERSASIAQVKSTESTEVQTPGGSAVGSGKNIPPPVTAVLTAVLAVGTNL